MKRKICFALLNVVLCLSMMGLTVSRNTSAQENQPDAALACGDDASQVGCWQMEEGSGYFILDGSSFDNDGDITGSPTWVPGHSGLALNLSGTGQYAIVPDDDSLDMGTNRITMSAWIKPTKSAAATQNIFKKTTGTTSPGYELSLSASGKVFVRFNGSAAYRVDSSTSYPLNGSKWMHIAATYDGTTIKLYIDGVSENPKNVSFTIGVTTINLGVGAEPAIPRINLFQGLLDDARIYDRALSADEIKSLFMETTPSGFTCTNLQSQAGTANTEHKPMSKVWYYQNKWWSVFPASSGVSESGSWLWRLDGTTWTPVYKLSSSTNTKVDVKPAGSPAGSLVHVLLYNGSGADLASAEYNSGTYQAWSGRGSLTNISLPGSETATIDIDSTGRMWLATQHDVTSPSNSREIIVYYSTSPYTTWSGPIILATGTTYNDDISLVTSLPNNTIGVLWSNQVSKRFGFRYHVDGVDPGEPNWSALEQPTSQYGYNTPGAGFADDHLNVAVASDSTLYAAVKTGYDTAGYPRIALLVRRPSGGSGAGVWDTNIYGVSETGTRGIVLLDETAGVVSVIYTSVEGGGNIIYKQTAIQPINFGSVQTMRSGTNNDVSSTKQNINSELVAIYSNGTTINGSQCTSMPSSGVDLSIAKTDNVLGALPGDPATYTITANNLSSSPVSGVTVADTFPTSLTNITWTCTASAGSSCTSAGTGDINDSITLGATSSVTYIVNATISLSATGTIQNTATVTPPVGVTDPNMANNSATDSTIIHTGTNLCENDANLVACYQLDEGSGSVFLDGVQNPFNDGNLINTPTWVSGMYNGGLRFNGTTQYGFTPDENSLDLTKNITLAVWVKPERYDANPQDLIKKATNGGTNGFELSLSSTGSSWPEKAFFRINQVASGDTCRVNSTSLYPHDGNTWVHIAATLSGTTLAIYINGAVEAQTTNASCASIITNSLPLSIGAQYDGATPSRWFQGTMDDVRIYNRALTASEIAALYRRPPAQPTNPVPAVGAKVDITDNHIDLQATVNDLDTPTNLTVNFYGRPYCPLNFSLVALPDTQYYSSQTSSGLRAMFDAQTTWIVSNSVSRNIPYVTHLGDIVDLASDTAQWNIAGKLTPTVGALTALDKAGIPYGLALGNHDGAPDNTGNFNSYFPYTRIGDGYFGIDNDNHYGLFSLDGLQFIVIHFEDDDTPDASVLAWADDLLSNQYPDHRGIVVFHNLVASSTQLTPRGQVIYDYLKHNANLFLMLGGHDPVSELALTLTDSGHTVYALRSDYQNRSGGNGWLRIMEFQPSANQIQVYTYSPYLSQWETDGDSQFTLAYPMGGQACTEFSLIGTVSGVSSGASPTLPWPDLLPAADYQWYVTISDGVNTTTGPVWWFTTNAPTPVRLDFFTATSLPHGIQLDWQTAQEIDLLGFNLYRAEAIDGPKDLLNSELIPAVNPGMLRGNAYQYLDTTPRASQVYFYWVEWVGPGSTELFGPVQASLVPFRIWLPIGLK